jgi:hypothetical protein
MAKIKTKRNAHHTIPKHTNRRAFEKVYWPYIPIVLAIVLLLGFGSTNGNLQAYVRHPGGRVLSYATSMSINSLLGDTNAERNTNGVGKLSLSNKLNAAAQAKADDMVARNYWSHYTPDGKAPWIFVTAQSYSYQKLGENLATGFADEQSTIDGWMASPAHKENLLDPAFKQVGFGFANNPNYTAAGGGPMTVIVAFYGNPQVLSATTQETVNQQTPKPAVKQVETQVAQTKNALSPEISNEQPPASKSQPVTTDAPQEVVTPDVKASRLQLGLGSTAFSSSISSLSLLLAVAVILLYAHRHTRAFHRFAVRGERYTIAHPLTDVGMIIVACFVFILSQTAGLIK